MNILIVGSKGFVGSHLFDSFNNQTNYFALGVDIVQRTENDPVNYISIQKLPVNWSEVISAHKIDICINASGSGNVALSIQDPKHDFHSNVVEVISLLESIRIFRPKCKYVHISSAAVYGNPQFLPISENHSLNPISPYGYHKMMGEIICKEYCSIYQLNMIIIRPFSLYGIGLRKQLIWDLCSNVVDNEEVNLFGTGTETRDFIHISDFVSLVQLVIDNSTFDGSILNAGSGIETSINEIADIFRNHYKFKRKINFTGSNKIGDPINWRANISKAVKLGHKCRKDLKSGIVEYINWFERLNDK